MKKLISILAIVLILAGTVYTRLIKRTKGFSLKKIHSQHQYSPRWDFGTPTNEQKKILERISAGTFTLLGSGKECYAFVSEDGQLVVKFFKQKHMRTQSILNHIPLPKSFKMLHQETIQRRTSHRNRLYSSYQIAYEHLPHHTGILYLHLNKTKNLLQTIDIITPSGKKHTLKLDEMEFLVQKRASSIFDYISQKMDHGDIEMAKACIVSILDHITSRKGLGIGDNDINCERNLGLINGLAVQIDVGEFYFSLPAPPNEEDFSAATDDLRRFLEARYPMLATFLQKTIHTYL